MSDSKQETTYLGLEVTRRCNLTCPHCFTASNQHSQEGASAGELRGWLDQIADLGVNYLALCGGEPLLRKDLEEVMFHGRSKGIHRYSMVSNGILCTANRARSLREAGLISAQISIDGVDAEDYDLVRNSGPAAYYHAIRGIRNLQDVGIDITIACILSPKNLLRAPEMVLLCEALKVRNLRYCTFVPSGRGGASEMKARYKINKEDLKRFSDFMAATETRQDIPARISIDHGAGPCGIRQHVKCDAGSMAYISSDGEVYPCTGLIAPEFSMGNMYRMPLKEILASPHRYDVRAIPKKELAGPCRTCENDECSGGCRGAAYFACGDLRGPVLNCILGPVKRTSSTLAGYAQES